MRADLREMLNRQANWQRSRAEKSWIEKLRESVRMRKTIYALRKRPAAKTDEKQRQTL